MPRSEDTAPAPPAAPRIAVAAYVRPAPGAGAGPNPAGAAEQRAALAVFAAAHFMEIVAAYEEAPSQGEDPAQWPAHRLLLQAAANPARAFEFVLVTEADRLTEAADAALRAAGSPPLYARQPQRNDDRALAARMRRAWAEAGAVEHRRRVAAGKRRVAVLGFFTGGGCPYGFRRQEITAGGQTRRLEHGQRLADRNARAVLVHGPQVEVEAVRRIFALYAHHGLSAREIARRLNAEGLASGPRHNPWSPERILFMLGNEIYAGVAAHGGWTVGEDGRRVRGDKHARARIPQAVPPIVSRDLFDAAQAVRTTRKRRPSDEEILDGLRRNLRRNGVLVRRLIQDDPELPTVQTLRKRFGSLAAAYERIGYLAPGDWEQRRAVERVRARHR